MTMLALLRHGETQWSRLRRIQGRTDIELDDAGRAALKHCCLPEEFRSFSAVSSPLKRCVQTADVLGLKDVTIEPRIAEMCWGQWEGRRLSELRLELGGAMLANEALGLDFTPAGGESPRQVFERVRPWLTEIARAGKPTLAVSHRGVIRVVFAAACAWDMRGRPPVKLDWSALHVFALDRSGHPSVARLNMPMGQAI